MTLLKHLVWASGLFALSAAASVHAAIVEIREHDDVVYALTSNQTILRFDLASGSELPSITLANPAQHFTVDGNDIITANNRELRSVSLIDSSTSYIGGTSANIAAIGAESGVIITVETDNTSRTYSAEGTLLGSTTASSSSVDFTQEKSANGITSFNYSSDYVCQLSISDSNTPASACTRVSDSDYGTASGANAASPQLVLLNTGYIIDAGARKVSSRLPALDIQTSANIENTLLIKTSTGELEQYSTQGIKQGTYTGSGSENYLTAYMDEYVGLTITDSGITGQYFSPDIDLTPTPVLTVAPLLPANDSSIIPEKIITMQDGKALIYDVETSGLYVWSLTDNAYIRSYNAGNDLIDAVYDEYSSAFFSIHRDGFLKTIDMTDTSSVLMPITYLPGSGWRNISAYMDKVYVMQNNGDMHTFTPQGTFTSLFGYSPNYIQPSYWDNEQSAYFALSSTYLYKYAYDTATATRTSSQYFFTGTLSETRISLLPELGVVALSNGKLISVSSLANTRTLSSNIYDAAYPASSLMTVSADRSALQAWSAAGELLNTIPQPANTDLRLVYDETYLGLIRVSASGTLISRYNLVSGDDSDTDTVSDLFDNCPDISNSDQADLDGDDIGDVCDLDEDGDGIPNSVEIAAGLNARDASDRDSDLDSDGMPNYYEYLIGTSISEVTTPRLTGHFSITFDNGLIPSYLVTSGGTWFTRTDYYGDGGYDLRSPAATDDKPLPYVLFYASFDGSGDLRFTFRSDNIYYSDQPKVLKVYIDNVEVAYSSRDGYRYVDGSGISTGIHAVKMELQVPGHNWNEPDEQLILDDITYETYIGPDYDEDDIPDSTDNCRWDYNPSQMDSDGDGEGDACDSYDNNWENEIIDWDVDGVDDGWDNCPDTYNPNQQDTDYDDIGDLCDSDIDNDGVDNDTETSLGRDPYTRESVWYDSDGDGVSDAIEQAFGNSITESDEYEPESLREYYPLGNITRKYRSEYWSDFTQTTTKSGETTYIQEYDSGSCQQIIEARDDGIYLIERICPEDDERVEYTNYMIFPAEMTPGEPVVIAAAYKVYEGEQLAHTDTISYVLTYSGRTTYKLNGQSYEAIELMYGNSPQNIQTFAKGLGYVTDGASYLYEYSAGELDSWKKSSSDGGGSVNLFWLFIAAIGVVFRKRTYH